MDSPDKIHHVLVIEDPSFRREIHLDAATYSIGRHSSNDIVLSCQKTSRNHATLLRRTDVKTNKFAYWVLDGDLQGNRSRNGIYINSKKTLVHELKDGDAIQFSGDARATYKITANLPDPQIQNVQPNTSQFSLEENALINKETIVSPAATSVTVSSSKSLLSDSTRQISLTELSPQPIIEIDLYGNITYINSAGIIHFKDIHHRKLSHPLLNNLISIYHQGEDNIINREISIGEKTFWQTAHYLPDNKVIRNYIVDISQQKSIERELQYKNKIYQTIVKNIQEAIIIVESATKQIVEVNSASSELLGYSEEQLLQMNIYEICLNSKGFAAILQRIIAQKTDFNGECLLRHQSGEIVKPEVKINLINSGERERICLTLNNLTEAKITSEPQINPESEKSLSEKELFRKQIMTAISNAERSENLLAIVFCKLYFIPDIRANLGEQKTKELLSTLGKRLSACIRSGDSVVHWQDDRYVLLMPQINGIEEVAKINQRIKKSVEQSFKLGTTNVTLNGCLGVAIYPQDGTQIDMLLANASTALQRAYKNQDSYQFYNESMNSQALVALELENLLKQALEREEFRLYYQPQIDLNTGKTEAVEALLRWQHPEFGLVTPNNFIKSAETTKLILPIGEWAMRQACKQYVQWQQEGLPTSRITISLSSVQFKQTNLVPKIAEILAETTLEPRWLELEINAVSLLENIEHSKTTLQKLKELGVYIAIDNFSAGFSVLEYLKHFPLDTLKIDRCLVQQITESPQDLAIATALIELGRGFNLRVVAEGVETQEQVDLLRQVNCQQMQGFWFSRPLEASEAGKLFSLDNSNSEA